MSIDSRWFLDINDFARSTPWLHVFFADYAKYGVALFALLMMRAWWVSRGASDRIMSASLLSPLLAAAVFLINQPISGHIREVRPYVRFPNALVLLGRTHDWSFPSDHAVISGAVTLSLFLVSRKLGYTSLAVAIVLAFSRVYSGVHYPQDVAVGLVEGAFIAFVLAVVFQAPTAKFVHWARRTNVGRAILTKR
jgi:membrane-associated phospholipid phosphatase